jgi:probable HAF family extracellular repeat protein
VFPPTAPWWSARLATPQGSGVPFAGRLRVGCKTSARWAAVGARLLVFPPTAPWWSATAYNAAGQWRAFRWTASRGMQDLGTLGGCCSYASGVSADGAVVVGMAYNAAGQGRAFRWTASGGMQDLGTLGGDWSVAYDVSADGAVVVGYGLQRRNAASCLSLDGFGWDARPRHAGRRWERGLWCFRRRRRGGRLRLQRRRAVIVPFAGRLLVGCKTSARWAAIGAMLMAFPPTAPWWSAGLKTPQGISCLSLDGVGRHGRPEHDLCQPADQRLGALGDAISPDGRYIVGWATTPPQGAAKPSCWIRASRSRGDVDATAAWTTPTCSPCCCVWQLAATGQRRPQLRRHHRRRGLADCAVQLRQWLLRRAFAACGVGCNLSSAPTTWQSVGMRENSVPVTASLSADATRRAGRLTAPTHSLCAARSSRRTACR